MWVYRDRYPAQLSGGQQQRVGIARAMAAEPSVMLMDEPFGALDIITRKILQDEIKDIQKGLGKTILFVTHDIHEAFKLGQRVIIMDDGRVKQYDTPSNILFHPANDYVARLVSSESLLEKLQVLQAASIMEPLDGPVPNGVRVRGDEPLSAVLCKFMEGGIPLVLVTDESGKVGGRILWKDFNRISMLNGGETEFNV